MCKKKTLGGKQVLQFTSTFQNYYTSNSGKAPLSMHVIYDKYARKAKQNNGLLGRKDASVICALE